MLIYTSKLRYFAGFFLVLFSLATVCDTFSHQTYLISIVADVYKCLFLKILPNRALIALNKGFDYEKTAYDGILAAWNNLTFF